MERLGMVKLFINYPQRLLGHTLYIQVVYNTISEMCFSWNVGLSEKEENARIAAIRFSGIFTQADILEF